MDPPKNLCGTQCNFSSKIAKLLCSNPFFSNREDIGQGFWREITAELETLATFVEGEGEEAKSRVG